MKYPGLELENFDKANIWRHYVFLLIKKYLKNGLLEVGAGIGSFTGNYERMFTDITITETDENNLNELKKKYSNKKNISISDEIVKNINKKFNSIIYLNVLEHIKEDTEEINLALEKINSNGYLVLLVPAHNKLYSKFDEAVGHHRRYQIDFFNKTKLKNGKLVDVYYLDCFGYFLYFINSFFFKEEIYPSKLKIFIWDKIFTPASILFDFLFRYKFGKNIMCIIQKE